MWGFDEDEALFTIRGLTTGVGTLERPPSKKIEGLTWSLDGMRLYGVGDNSLWRQNCTSGTLTPGGCSAGSWVLISDDLPGGEFERLETSRDPADIGLGHDVLILANHGNATFFWWDVITSTVLRTLGTGGHSDVEGIVVCK